MKKCSKCQLEQDISNFTKRVLSKDGLDFWCKKCKRVHENSKKNDPLYVGEKQCTSCNKLKLRIDFHKDHRKIDGLEGRCKSCGNTRSHEMHLKRQYDLPIATYEEILLSQASRCAICGTSYPGSHSNPKIKRFAVDHDHKASRVRGLLCSYCNTGLGQFKDNISFLRKAIEYLSGTVGQE